MSLFSRTRPILPIPLTGTITPVSLWSSSATPATVDSGDTNSTALGVKFYTDVPGQVLGILFYKASTNTGTHQGDLWTSSGTNLATVTFTNESPSGWQQMLFANPVSISTSTVYVASYFAPNGHYSATSYYFSTSGYNNPPLHSPIDGGLMGANGIYSYSATDTFPSNSYHSTNYWVDVLFLPSVFTGNVSGYYSPGPATEADTYYGITGQANSPAVVEIRAGSATGSLVDSFYAPGGPFVRDFTPRGIRVIGGIYVNVVSGTISNATLYRG